MIQRKHKTSKEEKINFEEVEQELIRNRFCREEIDKICHKYGLIPEVIHAGLKEYDRQKLKEIGHGY